MKSNILITLIFNLLCSSVIGQTINFTFEQDTNFPKYISFSAGLNNQWQVGRPNKATFDAAFSLPNALVTDTADTYAPSNNSSFLLWQIVTLPAIDIYYRYKMNSDTLVDYAKIEASINGGLTWLDLSAHNGPYHFWFPPPIYSGNTNGWKYAILELYVAGLGLTPGDTVLFKFSFVSDEIDTYKDGWMIDDISILHSFGVGIEERNDVSPDLFQTIYYGNNQIELIKCRDEDVSHSTLQIYDLSGKKLYSFNLSNNASNVFNFPDLPQGLYLCFIERRGTILQSWRFVHVK